MEKNKIKMKSEIETIELIRLAPVFIPVILVLFFLIKWSIQARTAVYALSRMLAQLLLVGYFLTFIFHSPRADIIIGILALMSAAASWIALRTIPDKRTSLYKNSLFSITLSSIAVLAIVIFVVLRTDPWYSPRVIIPLAGMIFSNAMTAVSLAAERFFSEMDRNLEYGQSRNKALGAALIPITNSLFAVGVVSLPGMMTGQILSGVSPLIAARYQIMIMAMIYGCSGMAVIIFLMLLSKKNLWK